MKKNKKLIVANWKMNPLTITDAKKIAVDIKKAMKNIKKTNVVLCPPFVYLSSLSLVTSTSLFLGAQNAFFEKAGAYTGEVSFSQLPQFKTSFVIVGHSERRAVGETLEIINKKVKAVVGDGMTAILCVGEKERDHHGDYLTVVREQIISGLRDISKKMLDHVVIAYEPIWSIGVGKTAMTSREIHEMYIFIKKVLREMYGLPADGIAILYGGSVNPENAGEIVRDGFVQGLLVGRDSVNSKNFVEIIRSVDTV